MSLVFCHLFVVVSFEGGIVLYNIVSFVNECIPECSRVAFRHLGAFYLEVTGLVNRGG